MTERAKNEDSLSPSELSTFCAQIAMIMKSDISVSEGISIMCDDMKETAGHEILEQIRDQVEAGSALFSALESTGKIPKYMVDMVQIGESTGKLDDVMDSLCTYYEREEAISKNIRSAVTYPMVMIVMMLFVITVLIVKVMPIFNDVFVQLGSEMSGFSLAIMNFGALIARYSYILIGIIAVLVVAYFLMRNSEAGRRMLKKWKERFVITRKLNAKIASGRFSSAMALMLSSGLDTDQALDMVYKLVDNEYTRAKITACKNYIAEGVAFSEALVKSDIFTGIYARMITVGFKTGSVDTIMAKLADRYEDEIDTHMGKIISAIEPTLVAVLSVIVGMILLSVMLPLMDIMSSIG